jgi:hypothetical protein
MSCRIIITRTRSKRLKKLLNFNKKNGHPARPDYPLPTSYLYGKIASTLCGQHQGGWCKPPWNLCTKGRSLLNPQRLKGLRPRVCSAHSGSLSPMARDTL